MTGHPVQPVQSSEPEGKRLPALEGEPPERYSVRGLANPSSLPCPSFAGSSACVQILLLMFLAPIPGASTPPNRAVPAKLLEAVEYEPCDYYCEFLNHPTTAYCVEVNGQILVGERAGGLWFGENDATSGRDLVGKEITARLDEGSIWISGGGQRTIKIRHGSNFEQFHDTRCLVEVHRPKLATAAKAQRPRDLPADAFALAGAQVGDYRTIIVWFSCDMNVATTTIGCKKWYPKGDSKGTEWYCPRTVDGRPVASGFQIDHLASREGQVVLASGEVLQFDHRWRINDELARPGEACY